MQHLQDLGEQRPSSLRGVAEDDSVVEVAALGRAPLLFWADHGGPAPPGAVAALWRDELVPPQPEALRGPQVAVEEHEGERRRVHHERRSLAAHPVGECQRSLPRAPIPRPGLRGFAEATQGPPRPGEVRRLRPDLVDV
eukprot:3759322-Pyramimonas_sp.AAC.1